MTEKSRTGFTLLEVMITLVLVSFLIIALSTMYWGGFKVAYSQIKRGGVKGEVGRAFINMAQELRQATSITTAGNFNLVFILDSDSNGVDETVRYLWGGAVGNPFKRIQISPLPTYTTTMVNSVNSLSFAYYNAANTILTQPVNAAQVRVVVVNITVTDGDETFQLRSEIKLRML